MNVLQSMFISGKALVAGPAQGLLVARCLYSKTKTGQALFGHEKSVVLNV